MPQHIRAKIGVTRLKRKATLGYLNSAETRQKMSIARKGKIPWNKGKKGVQVSTRRGIPLSRETRDKISASLLGTHLPEEQKQKISKALSGRPAHNKGIPHSDETKRKMGLSHKGIIFSPERRRRISEALRGPKNIRWIADRSKLADRHDCDLVAYAEWRLAVYRRDNFKCKMTDASCSGRIEAHHILPWRDFVDLRFVVNNGITLCKFHHPLKRADEKRLSPYFQSLITSDLQ
jgi:hypothetical protein